MRKPEKGAPWPISHFCSLFFVSAVCLQAVAGQRIGLFSLLFSFLEPGFVKWVERTVLTEAPADRRVFFRHLCACAGPGLSGRGRNISVSNELQRSVVIQWHLCKQSSILNMNISNG